MNTNLKKLRILIVDDEVLIAEDIKDILVEFGCEFIELAHSLNEAKLKLQEFQPDLALLDIRMNTELEGLDLAKFINEHAKIPYIFITAHSDMSMIEKIIKTNPFAYITKPLKRSDLFANLNLLVEQEYIRSSSHIQIKDGYKTAIIPFDDVLYIEGEGNYINIYTQNKKWISRQSLENILESISSQKFVRIHRSFIVNISKVNKFSKKELEINGTKLPVSRSFGETIENYFK